MQMDTTLKTFYSTCLNYNGPVSEQGLMLTPCCSLPIDFRTSHAVTSTSGFNMCAHIMYKIKH